MTIRTAIVLASLVVGGAAVAQETPPAYVDNRSGAETLVKSLYNAINRKEYGRAWSYYGEDKPSASMQAFADGYKDTKQIIVKTGAVTSEGAAGSTFFSVPVAIEAQGPGDDTKVFSGCYTARLADPQVQADAFQPLHLTKGELKPSDESFAGTDPGPCPPGGQPVAADAALDQAKASYAATYGTTCDRANPTTGLPDDEPGDATIKYKDTNDAASDPERTARLISFPCASGAYNFSTVYYLWDDLSGVRQVQFPTPQFDVVYENPEETENSPVKEITVTGFSASDQVINSEFDPADNAITSWEKWRGVGDASSNGKWVFRNGSFVLVKYDVDASYDGEIEGQTIVDYDTTP